MPELKNSLERVSVSKETTDDQHLEKQVLALDSLSELTRQFASKPDFEELLNTILYTFSGQFGVGTCFISVCNPQSKSDKPVFASIGKFKSKISLMLCGVPESSDNSFLKQNKAFRIEEIPVEIDSPIAKNVLDITGLKVIVPLVHSGKLFGIIGLGDKLKAAAYTDSELDLMTSIANAITPLLVNSFLFKEIAELSNWYHEIINNVKQGVFVFDENKVLSGINQSGAEIMTKITCAEFDKHSISRYKLDELFSEKHFQGWNEKIEALISGSDSDLIENAIAGSGDFKQIFNVRVSVIKRKEAGRGDVVVTLDEITEQKQNEQRMFDLERLADKGVMAASISHELNNFLGLILAGVEMTQASIERNRTDDADVSLEKVKANISKMIRYTAGLMDYSRLDTNMQKVNLNEIIEDVLSFVVVQRRFKDYSVKTRLAGSIPELELDEDQIAQLLMNLLNNAADAIAEAKQKAGNIEITTSVYDTSVVLKIRDDGIGMTPEVKEKLFKKQLTTKKTGHGFGLVTCGKIIANHNGKVDIISEPGSGTTFEIRFPR